MDSSPSFPRDFEYTTVYWNPADGVLARGKVNGEHFEVRLLDNSNVALPTSTNGRAIASLVQQLLGWEMTKLLAIKKPERQAVQATTTHNIYLVSGQYLSALKGGKCAD